MACKVCGLRDTSLCANCPTRAIRWRHAVGRISWLYPEVPYWVAVAFGAIGYWLGKHG